MATIPLPDCKRLLRSSLLFMQTLESATIRATPKSRHRPSGDQPAIKAVCKAGCIVQSGGSVPQASERALLRL